MNYSIEITDAILEGNKNRMAMLILTNALVEAQRLHVEEEFREVARLWSDREYKAETRHEERG